MNKETAAKRDRPRPAWRTTNFVKPGDPNANAAHFAGMQARNFVSATEANAVAEAIEKSSGRAVRRVGEEDVKAFARRDNKIQKASRTRTTMSPSVARRELLSFERRYAGRVPPDVDAAYMNDCRHALGVPEVDYSAEVPDERRRDFRGEFEAFAMHADGVREQLCADMDDRALLEVIAAQDTSEGVRTIAEARLGELLAARASSKG